MGALTALAHIREAARLRRRYPTPGAFLLALDQFWGPRGHVTSRDASLHLGACPSCRSRVTTRASWTAWPLVIAAGPGPLDFFATCGCPPLAILAALVAAERDLLDRELCDLESEAA